MVQGATLFKRQNDRTSANWLYNLHVERRDKFVATMAYRGVETSIVHERNDEIPIFREFKKEEYPNLDRINKDRVCLPLHQHLSDEDVEYVIDAIKKGW